jgi:hypothetical protein
MAQLMIEIKGGFDSRRLWSLIKRYKVNLTDLGDTVLVYGDISFHDAVDVIAFCSMFGEMKSDYGGD